MNHSPHTSVLYRTATAALFRWGFYERDDGRWAADVDGIRIVLDPETNEVQVTDMTGARKSPVFRATPDECLLCDDTSTWRYHVLSRTRVDRHRSWSFERIVELAAARYGVKPIDVISESRFERVVKARHTAMFLALQLGATATEIGEYFDRRHDVVGAAIRSIQWRIPYEKDIADAVRDLRRVVYSETRPTETAAATAA